MQSLPAAAETVEIKGYLYDLNKEDHVAILMRYNGTSTTVVIPTTIKFADVEYHVTTIHNRAFRDSKMQKFIKKLSICRCTKLSSIVIPNTVISIGNYAFADCLSLKNVAFGNNVASIGEKAFSYCNKLKTITCLAREVPETEPSAFKYSDITSIVDKLPIENYKKAEPWCSFENVKSL